MLKNEIDIRVCYDPITKELEINNLLAENKKPANIIFVGIETHETLIQALSAGIKAMLET